MTLQEWMDLKGWNDRDVAERVEGLSRSQISRIRRRKSIPPADTARKLEELTSIPAAVFVLTDRAA